MNAHAAYASLNAMGINPFMQHCVIDTGAGENYRHFTVGHAPTLTKTRAGNFGYWDSMKGGPLDAYDMCKLMGFSGRHLRWQSSMTPGQLGAALDNGCSVTMMNKIIPNIFYAAGYITSPQLNLLMQHSEMYRMSLKSDAPQVIYS